MIRDIFVVVFITACMVLAGCAVVGETESSREMSHRPAVVDADGRLVSPPETIYREQVKTRQPSRAVTPAEMALPTIDVGKGRTGPSATSTGAADRIDQALAMYGSWPLWGLILMFAGAAYLIARFKFPPLKAAPLWVGWLLLGGGLLVAVFPFVLNEIRPMIKMVAFGVLLLSVLVGVSWWHNRRLEKQQPAPDDSGAVSNEPIAET
jgi:cytochrome c oxidase subunit IV